MFTMCTVTSGKAFLFSLLISSMHPVQQLFASFCLKLTHQVTRLFYLNFKKIIVIIKQIHNSLEDICMGKIIY